MFVTHIFLLTSVQFWTKPSFLDPAQPWHVALFSPPANKMSWRHGPFNSFHQNTRSRYTPHLPPHQCYAKKNRFKTKDFWGKKRVISVGSNFFSFLRLFFEAIFFSSFFSFWSILYFYFCSGNKSVSFFFFFFFCIRKHLLFCVFMPKDGFQVIKSTFVPYRDNFFFWTLLPSAGCFCLNRFLG